MSRISPRPLQAYALLVLLVVSVSSPLPYALLAISLLLALLVVVLRAVPARINLAVTISVLFLMPIAAAQFFGNAAGLPLDVAGLVATALDLPVLVLVDDALRRNNRAAGPAALERREGRRVSGNCFSLMVLAAVMTFLAFVLDNRALLFTSIMYTLYLLAVLLRVFRAVPSRPFEVAPAWRRVIAGRTIDVSQRVSRLASISLHALLTPADSWVKVTPEQSVMAERELRLNLSVTPRLAGPSRPRLWISAVDPRGLVQVEQWVEPVQLHVIPRARYAQWLAMKYLEQARPGVVAGVLPPKAVVMPKRGIEYYSSRGYQPGDETRDIDWKHSVKLNQLIVKECIESGSQAAIMAVNLTAGGIEEADKLAYNLITAALTLAEEGIPTAIAAYTKERVILEQTVTDPREVLTQVLSLVKDIDAGTLSVRLLAVPDLGGLRRNIARLERAQSEPAQRLLKLLNFERRALEYAVHDHPAMVAITRVAERSPAQAMIVLVSELNHDAEAIQAVSERLSGQGFVIVPVTDSR